MDMLKWQKRVEEVVADQDIYTWLDALEKDVRVLKRAYGKPNQCSEPVRDEITNILIDIAMVAELIPVNLNALAETFLRSKTAGYVCSLCPGEVPLLKGEPTSYGAYPHYYCPACKCIYPEGSLEK